ncbi:hypothetical protein [Nocardiopsis baichengensis]|uniref:hypothetical protein n=1 Tax=Nocardiopsis baichengensis TaxID=280240 RepID=UPI0003472F16|nr:hypothetical protein [Nocardiopsis baichengensis]
MMWFPRRRGAASRGRFPHRFSTFPESADRGLFFRADIAYRWRLLDGGARLLQPGAVARSLLADTIAEAVARFPALSAQDAQTAAQGRLSEEIEDGDHLAVAGEVRLHLDPGVEAEARERASAAQRVRMREAAETARLEEVRNRFLQPDVAMAWWLERFADDVFTAQDPEDKVRSAVGAFRELASVLRTGAGQEDLRVPRGIRARVDELLAVLEDPHQRSAAVALLEMHLDLIRQGGAEVRTPRER